MMKFKNINTGVVLETTNEFVIEQLKKSNDYVEIKETTKKNKKDTEEIVSEKEI